jgi:predicted porin
MILSLCGCVLDTTCSIIADLALEKSFASKLTGDKQMKVNKKKLFIGAGIVVAVAIAIAVLFPTTQAKADEANVKIYGNVDVGVQSIDNGTDTLKRVQDGQFNTSRLGVTATSPSVEGLKIIGQLEGKLSTTEGEFGSTTSTGGTFNREASIAVQGSAGTVKAGKTDVTALNDLDTLAWNAGNFTNIPTNGTAIELGGDTSRVFKYISPDMSGFQVQVGGSFNSNSATADAQDKLKGASLTYTNENIRVGLGRVYQDGATTVAEKDATAISGSVKLGTVTVGAVHAYGDTSTTSSDVKSTASLVSVKLPLNDTTSITGIYGQAKDDSQATLNEGTGYGVVVEKQLFAGVTLYGAYSTVDNDANSSMSMAGLGTVVAGKDASAFTAGINYKF